MALPEFPFAVPTSVGRHRLGAEDGRGLGHVDSDVAGMLGRAGASAGHLLRVVEAAGR